MAGYEIPLFLDEEIAFSFLVDNKPPNEKIIPKT